MAADPLAFLDDIDVSQVKSTDPLSFLDKPKRSKAEKAARIGGRLAIGAAELGAFPYEVAVAPLASKGAQTAEYRKNLFEDIERLSEQKQTGVWDEQDENLLKNLISQVRNPNKAEKFVKTADIGISGLAEKAAETLGYDLKPEGFAEHAAQIAGNIVSPKQALKLAKNAPSFIKNIAKKEARSAAKTEANWKHLEKVAKVDPEKKTLIKFAKEKSLSPEATTLLFQAEGKVENLGRLAKGKKFEGAIGELKDKLGKEYNSLKTLGKEGGYLNFEETDKLTGNLDKILREMNATAVIGPNTAPVITTVENAIKRLHNNPNSIKELINSRQGLEQGINWRDIDAGDFFRKQMKEAFSKAIKEKNPAIYERLVHNDRAWAKYAKYQDILDKRLPTIKVKGIEIPKKLLTLAAFGSALMPIPFVGKSAALVATLKEAIQKLSTELLMNPKFQAPLRKLVEAISRGDTKNIKQAFLVIRNMTKKEAPEVYESVKDIEFE